MHTDDRSRRRREVITTVALTILSGIAFFAACWILTGWIVVAVMVALVAMAVVGGLHYALWGRELAREVRRKDDYPPFPPRRMT
jgi:hypothetical protein